MVSLQQHIGKALDLVEDLRTILPDSSPIELPSVVVLGCQSAGKSSLIERLSGVQLPQAENLCTRAALVLQMRRSKEAGAPPRFWIWSDGEKGNKQEEIKEAEVKTKILKFTEDLTESSMDITKKKIYLKVERPDLHDYTLIDMPGLVYNPMEGQREDIFHHVRDMLLEVIKPENTLILCVFTVSFFLSSYPLLPFLFPLVFCIHFLFFKQGGTNIEAQESRKLAAEADPEGKRTIGVLTKLDIQLAQSSADELRDVLQQVRVHEKLKLKLGMFAIRNRTQQETREDLPLQQLDIIEKELMKKYGVEDLASLVGMNQLSKRLAEILAKKIRTWIPGALQLIKLEKAKIRERLNNSILCSGELESYRYLFQVAEPLQRRLFELEQGTLPSALMEQSPVNYFKDVYCDEVLKALQEKIVRSSFNGTNKFQEKLKISQGSSLPDFINDRVFEAIALPIVRECCSIIRAAFQDCCGPLREFFIERTKEAVENHPERVQEYFVGICVTYCDIQIRRAIEAVHEAMILEESKVLTLNPSYVTTKTAILEFIMGEDTQSSEWPLEEVVENLRTMAQVGARDSEIHRIFCFQVSLFSYLWIVLQRSLDEIWKLFWCKLIIGADRRFREYLNSLPQKGVVAAMSSTQEERDEGTRLEANLSRYADAEKMVGEFYDLTQLQRPLPLNGFESKGRPERSWDLHLEEEETQEQIFVKVDLKHQSLISLSSSHPKRKDLKVGYIEGESESKLVIEYKPGSDPVCDIKCCLTGNPNREWEFKGSEVSTYKSIWDSLRRTKVLIGIKNEDLGRYKPSPLLLSLTFLN